MSLLNRFTVTFNPADVVSWLILLLLAVLLVVQVGLVVRNDTLPVRRKWIRGILNILLWSLLLAYFLQIEWEIKPDSKPVWIVDSDVPGSAVNQLKDSLKNREVVRINAFKEASFRSRLTDGMIDTVTLIGTGFSPDVLGQLSRQTVEWIPYAQPDQVQMLRWKAILRKGEMQSVRGRLQSSQEQILKLRFGNQTLDSLSVKTGTTAFNFQFPAFSQGRTELTLVLDQKPLDTLRYFTRSSEPIAYQFILDSPDFESKTLADWLGKKGYSVQVTSTISKDLSNRLSINRVAMPDVIITDPANATNPVVKKAVMQGKPVLFINLSDAETDTKTINRALGTSWKLKRLSNEATIPIGTGLQALPFQFSEALNQFSVAGSPVAVQKTTAKIGVSLVSETFPLKLSGDSVTYDRIWTAILTPLQPTFANNIQLDAPVFKSLRSIIHFNNLTRKPAEIRLGNDTVRLDYSAINPLSADVSYGFGRVGWQSFQDSLAVYVDNPNEKPVFGNRLVSDYLRARSTVAVETNPDSEGGFPAKIPDWVWILLFLSGLTALWVEPKFSI
ncbi:hypothetical protein [Larkinella punicea]|uniref:Aerotolerance regulator N-terminal domain-containing protein n=1 Tax=Larkinella punicea TaxID=2315727 RepID=A0A368JVI9_9BACT|nr:hypothetical protein [Larkinella punicea]RCR71680.1 hypothetical protein DUE52_01810 [Larkinella punicea]